MIASRTQSEFRGRVIHTHIKFCVLKSLTDEVDDIAFDCVRDFIDVELPTSELVENQTVMVEVLKYYLQDTLTAKSCLSYSIVADDRNNPAENEGKEFIIDVKFTAKHSLIPTHIRYVIEY